MAKKRSSTAISELGIPYRIMPGLCPPPEARWRLIYWDFVVYFASHKAAEVYRDGGKYKGRGKSRVRVPNLTYHQREDCVIERQPRVTVTKG